MSTENKSSDLKTLNSTANSLPKSTFNIALKPSILKPPQLNVSYSSSNSSKPIKPSSPVLNQFPPKDSKDDTSEEKKVENEGTLTKTTSSEKSNPTIVSITSTASLSTSTVSSTSFVFGQNLKDRVIAIETETETDKEDPKPSTSVSTNGTTEMLFSDAIKTDLKSNISVNGKENKSLVETAREYEESRAVKRKFEEVEIKTGEEDETNILCISCKLFSYDGSSGSWQERGRGTLRLNDFEADNRTQSRLVFRTSGSLRVILNTKVFSSMKAEKASEKSTRLTALDADGEIKIFLVMASIDDSKSLLQHLEQRIKMEVEVCKKKKN